MLIYHQTFPNPIFKIVDIVKKTRHCDPQIALECFQKYIPCLIDGSKKVSSEKFSSNSSTTSKALFSYHEGKYMIDYFLNT